MRRQCAGKGVPVIVHHFDAWGWRTSRKKAKIWFAQCFRPSMAAAPQKKAAAGKPDHREGKRAMGQALSKHCASCIGEPSVKWFGQT
jgi:hypothetical protein